MRLNLKKEKKQIGRLVKQLLVTYSKEDLVNCLVSIFINDNNINTKNQIILNCINNAKKYDMVHIREILKSEKYDLELLQNAFECLIDDHTRQGYGVVYTPNVVTEYITRSIVEQDTKTVCDPACGTGVFLLNALKIIYQLSDRPVSDIIEKNIYGADLLEEHIIYSKIILTLYMLLMGEDKANLNFNLTHCDSLTFDWKQKYPEIEDGFDVIIGNPPYIRIQDISDNKKLELEQRWKTCIGSYNIYFTFFELGIELLNNSGKLGYICSNSFFTSFAGKNLRKWLQKNRYVQKILDFKHLVLFDAVSYTCIAFLDKKKKTSIEYGYVSNYVELEHLDTVNFDNNPYFKLNYNKWRLLKTNEREIIEKIESTGQPLGKISDIHSGIATLKDKIYFLPYSNDRYIQKMYEGKMYKIESSITRNIIKIPDIKNKSGQVQPTHKIIFPYKKVNGRYELLLENELKTEYPGCYQYLCAVKDILATRDKGKRRYKAWYSYGRVQGFEIDDKKLLTPTFSSKPRFHFDINGDSFFCNGYAIRNTRLPLKVIQKILNSMIMSYYISKTSVFVEGGYCCFQKNFIEKFGIPNLTDLEIHNIQTINDTDKLNKLLIKKYGVNMLMN